TLDDLVDDVGPGGEFALAHQFPVCLVSLDPRQTLAEPVVAPGATVRERLQVGGAGSVDVEIAADGVDCDFGPLPERAPLAGGDGQKPLDTVARGVVEEGVGAGHVAGVGGRFLLIQGPYAGPGPEHPGRRDPGDQLVTLLKHQLDLPGLHGEALRVGDAFVGGADLGDREAGDDDVAVVGDLATVYHGVEDAEVDRDDRPLAGLYDELGVDGAGK